MITGQNQLTDEKKRLSKQGVKIEFKWHGSNNLYTGRIEVDNYGNLYFVNEHNYENDKIKTLNEGFRWYNSLESFFFFTYFEIIS